MSVSVVKFRVGLSRSMLITCIKESIRTRTPDTTVDRNTLRETGEQEKRADKDADRWKDRGDTQAESHWWRSYSAK